MQQQFHHALTRKRPLRRGPGGGYSSRYNKSPTMDSITTKKKLVIRAIVLPLLLIIHVITGTFVFLHYEGTEEVRRGVDRAKEKAHLLIHAKNLTDETMNKLKYLLKQGCFKDHNTRSHHNWGFWDAFAFAFTVISTIGYGVVAPHDIEGRLFCIMYAFIGIPLMTLHLAIINVVILRGINKLDTRLIKFKKRLHIRTSMIFKISVISIAFILFLNFHFVIFWVIQHVRRKSNTGFLDSIYFAVITYGTVGFGDITPQSMNFTETMEVFRVLVFASTGLALVSLCFSLYREAMNKSKRLIARRISVMPQFQHLEQITEAIVARSRANSIIQRPSSILRPLARTLSEDSGGRWAKVRNISLVELQVKGGRKYNPEELNNGEISFNYRTMTVGENGI